MPFPSAALVILDGWGIAPAGPGNAVDLASTPVFDELWSRYPHTQLVACGEAVGLPPGQMGNSEVGHLNLGAGAVVKQDLVRINEADFGEDEALASGMWTRLAGDNLRRNVELVRTVEEVAAARAATPGQVALAWLLARGDRIVPIPGTKRVRYLEENVGALDVDLTPADLARLDALEPAGDRYPDMSWVERDTPEGALR